MIPKPAEEIERDDILRLVQDVVAESRTLDYKQALPGNSDAERKEFLADVVSFANAHGGDIVFGMVERRDSSGRNTGVPQSAEGIQFNADAETLRLENAIRDGVAPRIPSVRFKAVNGFPGGAVFVLRVGRSWTSPHMVTFKSTPRFYSRNSAGKFHMDVGEIRSAFAMGEQIPERLRRFRDERLMQILGSETSIRLRAGPKSVMHIVPVSALDPASQLDPQLVQPHQKSLEPIYASGWGHRYNLDGFATFTPGADGVPFTYVQVFRSGALEAVEATIMQAGGERGLPPTVWESYMVAALRRFIPVLVALGGQMPFFVMLTLADVKDVPYVVRPDLLLITTPTTLSREVVRLPDVIVERQDIDVPKTMRPVFDALWQAAGFERSYNYAADGRWTSDSHR